MLKFVVGFTHIVTLAMGLMGVLPFACWTSAMVAYGVAGEMVKLAESNMQSEAVLAERGLGRSNKTAPGFRLGGCH